MAFDGDWIHGATIDKRTKALRFVSVSSLDKGDHGGGGCNRAWHYRYVEKIKLPDDDRQKNGREGHANLASHLLTGDPAVRADIARGLEFVPAPGPDLLIEWDLLKYPGLSYPAKLTSAHSPILLENAPVKLAGVPLLGSIDCAHHRGINYGAESPEEAKDPDGTIEVIDWKFVGGTKFIKKPSDLVHDTQLAGYASWVWAVRPETPFVRLSLGYFPVQGSPRKVSKLIRREEVQKQIDHMSGVVRVLGEVAKEPDVERTPYNLEACDKYGGCDYKDRCNARKNKALADLIGITAAESLVVPAPTQAPAPQGWSSQGVIPVGSLLQRSQGGVQTSVQPNPAPAGPSAAEVAAEKARVEAEQAAARLKAYIPAGFVEACAKVRAFNQGFPTLLGSASRALLATQGKDVGPAQPPEIPGTGEISYVKLDDANMMAKLVEDLEAEAAANPTATTLPPDAPASEPRLAADAGPSTTAAPAPQTQMPVMQTSPDPMKAPETEAQKPAPKKRGKKVETAGTAPVADSDDTALHIYVDCATSYQTVSLNDWAQQCADTLAQKFGALDVRCGGEDTPLGYDKWKGALVAFVRDDKLTPLAPGYYKLDVRFSSVMQAVAEGLELRIRARTDGSSYTRGVR